MPATPPYEIRYTRDADQTYHCHITLNGDTVLYTIKQDVFYTAARFVPTAVTWTQLDRWIDALERWDVEWLSPDRYELSPYTFVSTLSVGPGRETALYLTLGPYRQHTRFDGTKFILEPRDALILPRANFVEFLREHRHLLDVTA